MKQFVAMVMLVVCLVMCAYVADAETRVDTGVVVAVNWIDCSILILTEDGNIWEYELDDEWSIGDMVRVRFDDCGTTAVYDDIIYELEYIDSLDDVFTVRFITAHTR